jgi:hypothetical protein
MFVEINHGKNKHGNTKGLTYVKGRVTHSKRKTQSLMSPAFKKKSFSLRTIKNTAIYYRSILKASL